MRFWVQIGGSPWRRHALGFGGGSVDGKNGGLASSKVLVPSCVLPIVVQLVLPPRCHALCRLASSCILPCPENLAGARIPWCFKRRSQVVLGERDLSSAELLSSSSSALGLVGLLECSRNAPKRSSGQSCTVWGLRRQNQLLATSRHTALECWKLINSNSARTAEANLEGAYFSESILKVKNLKVLRHVDGL